MKLLKSLKTFRIERLLQLTAHPTYIVLGVFFFYGFQRPLYQYLFLMLSNYFFYLIAMSIANKFYDRKESLLTLTPIIMAGNIMLNMEAYDFKSYALAGLFGVISRALLRTKHGHIFNPGIFGVFFFVMMFPQNGHSSLGLWQPNLSFLILIFLLGHFVVYKARRLGLIYGYILGFSFLAIFISIFLKSAGLHYNGLEDMPILFWPSTLTTATSLFFIFHVISDPKTSPSSLKEQLIFGALIGLVDFFLRTALIIPAEITAYLFVQALYGIKNAYADKSE